MIREVFSIYSRYAAPLLFTALAIFLVVGTVSGLLNDSDSIVLQFVATAIQLAATALYTGFVVKLVEDVRDGRRDFSVGELFYSGRSIWRLTQRRSSGAGHRDRASSP